MNDMNINANQSNFTNKSLPPKPPTVVQKELESIPIEETHEKTGGIKAKSDVIPVSAGKVGTAAQDYLPASSSVSQPLEKSLTAKSGANPTSSTNLKPSKSSMKKITHKPGEKSTIEFENFVVSSPVKKTAEIHLNDLKAKSGSLESYMEEVIKYVKSTLEQINEMYGSSSVDAVEALLNDIGFDWPSEDHSSAINYNDRNFLLQAMGCLFLYPENDLKKEFNKLGFKPEFFESVSTTIKNTLQDLSAEIEDLVQNFDSLKSRDINQLVEVLLKSQPEKEDPEEKSLKPFLDEFLTNILSLSRNIVAEDSKLSQERQESPAMSKLRQDNYQMFLTKINLEHDEEYKKEKAARIAREKKTPQTKIPAHEQQAEFIKLNIQPTIQVWTPANANTYLETTTTIQSHNIRSGKNPAVKMTLPQMQGWIIAQIKEQISEKTQQKGPLELTHSIVQEIKNEVKAKIEGYLKGLSMETQPIKDQYMQALDQQIDICENQAIKAQIGAYIKTIEKEVNLDNVGDIQDTLATQIRGDLESQGIEDDTLIKKYMQELDHQIDILEEELKIESMRGLIETSVEEEIEKIESSQTSLAINHTILQKIKNAVKVKFEKSLKSQNLENGPVHKKMFLEGLDERFAFLENKLIKEKISTYIESLTNEITKENVQQISLILTADIEKGLQSEGLEKAPIKAKYMQELSRQVNEKVQIYNEKVQTMVMTKWIREKINRRIRSFTGTHNQAAVQNIENTVKNLINRDLHKQGLENDPIKEKWMKLLQMQVYTLKIDLMKQEIGYYIQEAEDQGKLHEENQETLKEELKALIKQDLKAQGLENDPIIEIYFEEVDFEVVDTILYNAMRNGITQQIEQKINDISTNRQIPLSIGNMQDIQDDLVQNSQKFLDSQGLLDTTENQRIYIDALHNEIGKEVENLPDKAITDWIKLKIYLLKNQITQQEGYEPDNDDLLKIQASLQDEIKVFLENLGLQNLETKYTQVLAEQINIDKLK